MPHGGVIAKCVGVAVRNEAAFAVSLWTLCLILHFVIIADGPVGLNDGSTCETDEHTRDEEPSQEN